MQYQMIGTSIHVFADTIHIIGGTYYYYYYNLQDRRQNMPVKT